MKIKDVKEIPYMIQKCGEDLSKLKQLKYDLMDDEIYYKDQLTGLQRDEYGICLDNKLFRTVKTNLQYIQRYLLQVLDIIKDINSQKNMGAKDKLILLSKMKDEREEAKREAYFERQKEQEKHRLEKERIKDERIKLQHEKESSKERLFITISKEYLSKTQYLEIFKRVEEIIK